MAQDNVIDLKSQNHRDDPIHDDGKLEGVSNKIKVIKRKVYGFDDTR